MINAIINDIKPESIASLPNEGPTTASSTMCAGAGNLPALSTFAKSFASSYVKFPVIEERPFGISPLTVGNE